MLPSYPSQQIFVIADVTIWSILLINCEALIYSSPACSIGIERIERKIVHIGTEKSSRQINDVKLENFSFILNGDFRFAFYELCFLWGSTFLALSSDTQTLRET